MNYDEPYCRNGWAVRRNGWYCTCDKCMKNRPAGEIERAMKEWREQETREATIGGAFGAGI